MPRLNNKLPALSRQNWQFLVRSHPFHRICNPKISSIRNNEYIDFNSLQSENIAGHDEHLKISFDALGLGFSIPVSMSQHKRQRIDSKERWLNAFNIFARVVAHFFSYKASELFYQQAIGNAHRKFSGMACYAYDIAFRKKATNDPSISWAHRDRQLYFEKFNGLAKTAYHVCGSADHFVNVCPIAPTRSMQRSTYDRCRNYNRKVPCVTNLDVLATIQHSTTMQELQSQALKNETANSYLQHLQPVTPVSMACLKHELENHPSALFVSNLLKGSMTVFLLVLRGHERRVFRVISRQQMNTLT